MFYSEEIEYSLMLICNHHFNMILLHVLNKTRYKAFSPTSYQMSDEQTLEYDNLRWLSATI